jgi:hypothetical protein
VTDAELKELTVKARRKVYDSKVGAMHSMWDVIFDAECVLDGTPTLLKGEPDEIRAYLENQLAAYVERP